MTEQLNMQSMRALEKANRYRSLKAEDKKKIARGELDPCLVLRYPPRHWRHGSLIELLLAIDRVGRCKASRWCRLEGVSLERRLDELTERQREMLARHIDVWRARRDNVRLSLEERVV